MEKTYNGWENYETWCVNLWVSNNQGIHESVIEALTETLKEYEGDKEEAARASHDYLPDMIFEVMLSEEEQNIVNRGGFLSDAFTSFWQNVNFREIAENYLSDIEWVDEDEAYEAGKARGERFAQFNKTRGDAYEAEQADRDFSPFEHTAHKLNGCVNSETAWERFDEGISDAISVLPSEDETEETK